MLREGVKIDHSTKEVYSMIRSYDVFILAAGYGSRLRPLTNNWPKCLMPIRGVPLLNFWLSSLDEVKTANILINAHYLSDVVSEYLEESGLIGKVSLVHERTLLGTAGSIRENEQSLGQHPVLVIHADNYSSINLNDFIAHHEMYRKSHNVAISMGLFECDNPDQCGICISNPDGLVCELYEKVPEPPGKTANAAVYIFEACVIKQIAMGNATDLATEVLPNYLGEIAGFRIRGFHRDIGSLDQLLKAQLEFMVHDGENLQFLNRYPGYVETMKFLEKKNETNGFGQ